MSLLQRWTLLCRVSQLHAVRTAGLEMLPEGIPDLPSWGVRRPKAEHCCGQVHWSEKSEPPREAGPAMHLQHLHAVRTLQLSCPGTTGTWPFPRLPPKPKGVLVSSRLYGDNQRGGPGNPCGAGGSREVASAPQQVFPPPSPQKCHNCSPTPSLWEDSV